MDAAVAVTSDDDALLLEAERRGKERMSGLMKSCGAIYFVSSILGASFGAVEAFAYRRPVFANATRTSMNLAILSTSTYLLRDCFKNVRQRLLHIPDDHSVMGAEGAMAGAISGFIACRYVGRHGRYAYIGAAWCAAVAGLVDVFLTQTWHDIQTTMNEHEKRSL